MLICSNSYIKDLRKKAQKNLRQSSHVLYILGKGRTRNYCKGVDAKYDTEAVVRDQLQTERILDTKSQ